MQKTIKNQYAGKCHELALTYRQFLKLDSSLEKVKIGKYYIYEFIDSGAFGSVYRAMNDQTKQQVAVKLINLREVQMEPNPKVKQIKRRLSKTESLYMMMCNSPNLLKCYEVFQNKELKIMIVQFCEGGTLANEVAIRKRIPQNQAILILKQIINGIAELHCHKIIHRDLKAQNILSHNGDYKIIDFGFSKELNINSQDNLAIGTCLGTVTTMAPQVYSRKPYNLKADIWSIGVIFFYMIFGEYPFKAESSQKLLKEVQIMEESLKIMTQYKGVKPSKKVIKFLREVLVEDIGKRLGWRQLKQHQIFKTHEDDKLPQQFRKNVKLNQVNDLAKVQNQLVIQKQQELYLKSNLSVDFEEDSKYQGKKQKIVQIQQINPHQLEVKKKQINKAEHEKFIWVKEAHLQCLKTQLIYENIILPIQANNLLELTKNNRNQVQMMYLLCTRCLNNMIVVKDQYERQKDNESVKTLHDTILKLHQNIVKIWTFYGELLTQIQNKFTSMLFDFKKKLFNKEQRQTKDRFLTGVQIIQHIKASRIIEQNQKVNENLCDYTKQQQIEYTLTYIQLNLKNLKTFGKVTMSVRNYLEHYKQISNIILEDLKMKNFNDYVRTMMV